MERKSLIFVCPNCGSNKVEEIKVDATVSSVLEYIDSGGDHDYELPMVEEGTVSHYQCYHCEYIIKDENDRTIDDCYLFAEWIEENCPQEGE